MEPYQHSTDEDGSKILLYTNGTRKVISSDGLSSTVYFFNGDIKKITPDGNVVCIHVY